MALATRCPHCGKMFRVASDQLKLRGGIVRCGACQQIFDGSAHLVDLDTPAPAVEDVPVYTVDFGHTFEPLGILPKPAEESAETTGHAVIKAEAVAAEAEHAAAEPEFAAAEAEHVAPEPEPVIPEPEPDMPEPEPFAPEPEPVEPEPEPVEPEPEPIAVAAASYAPHGARIEPTLAFPVDEELVAAPVPGHGHDEFSGHGGTRHATLDAAQHAAAPPPPRPAATGPLPMREAAGVEIGSPAARPARPRPADARTGRRSKLTPSKIPAPKLRVPEIDEPEFVKRSRRQEQTGKSRRILMAAGSVVLLLALAAQLAIGARNELAARIPAAKPALAAACALFGCRVELPARIENLVIETGELTTLGANTYSLSTLLRNQGNLVQAWPHVELVLTDANDKPLLRRVFTPAEYLPQGVAPAAGFAAHAEQPVKLYFQLDQLKPSGYRIAVFYP